MPNMPSTFRPPNARSRAEVKREADQRRGSARSRGYDHEWDKAARAHRQRHPLCRYCAVGAFGLARVRAADLVDHLYPHQGDAAVFWHRPHWISSCTDCHSGPKQALERQGPRALADLARLLGLTPRGEGG